MVYSSALVTVQYLILKTDELSETADNAKDVVYEILKEEKDSFERHIINDIEQCGNVLERKLADNAFRQRLSFDADYRNEVSNMNLGLPLEHILQFLGILLKICANR